MSLNTLHVPPKRNINPRIVVCGVGGAGCNAVNNMMMKGLQGAEFIVANTDAQSLDSSSADVKIQLGAELTQGLGAGSNPEVGLKAAEETTDTILEHFDGVHMCFITAGMGGGTGTGAGPYIAKLAREAGILTVGVITKPFAFEGQRRMDVALDGLVELRSAVHTLLVVPNENLFLMANENTTTTDAFIKADDVLYQAVKGVTDLIIRPGLINLDFADVKSVMLETGSAMMGSGEAEGADRGAKAAEMAMNNPLLEETCLADARGILINVVGGSDLTLWDLNSASTTVREGVNKNARVILGSTLEPSLEGVVRVSLVATGLSPAPGEQAGALESSFEEANRGDSFFERIDKDAAATANSAADVDTWDGNVLADSARNGHGSEERPQTPAPRRGGFVAPRPAARVEPPLQAEMPSASAARAEQAPPAEAERTDTGQSARRGIGGVFSRMTKPYDGAREGAGDGGQPRLTSSPGYRHGNDSEPDLRTPAFMRRQAN